MVVQLSDFTKTNNVWEVYLKAHYDQKNLDHTIFTILTTYSADTLPSHKIDTNTRIPSQELINLKEKTMQALNDRLEECAWCITKTNSIAGIQAIIDTINTTNHLLEIYAAWEHIHKLIQQNNTFSIQKPYHPQSRYTPEDLRRKKKKTKTPLISIEEKSTSEIIALMHKIWFTNADQLWNKINKAQKRVRKDLFNHLSLAQRFQTEMNKSIFHTYDIIHFNDINQLYSQLFVWKLSYNNWAYRLIYNPETKEIIDLCNHKKYERKYLKK